MTIYKGCPYCTAVFAVGPEEDEPLRRHIAHAHTDPSADAPDPELVVATTPDVARAALDRADADALRVRLLDADRTTRDLTLALLARQGVGVGTLAEWFGLRESTVRERLAVVDRALAAQREDTVHGGEDERGREDGETPPDSRHTSDSRHVPDSSPDR
jgi:hypothetical protein